MKERKLNERFDAGKFIEIWNASTSLSEVAEKTKFKKTSCKTLASSLRTKGAALKRFRRLKAVAA